MKKLIIGVLASGRGSNLQSIIDHIKSGKISAKIGCVISDNKDAFALKRAQREGIPAYYIYPGTHKTFLDPECEKEYVECLKRHDVELVCLAGFMRILKKQFLEAYRGRIMNIHPALLPSFPGLHAQKQAWEYGVKVAGATVHFVDEGVDTGPIIFQEAVKVEPDDTVENLQKKIHKEEEKLLCKAIKLFARDKIKVEGRKVWIK